MSDFRARLMQERTQLLDRIKKLEAFLLTDKIDKLEEIERKDMREQLQHMRAYANVLDRRVSRLCNNA